MRTFLGALVGAIFSCLTATAHAACEASFAEGATSVSLVSGTAFGEQELAERFFVRVRNSGADACALRLVVSRDLASSDPRFPAFLLVGPAGAIPIVAATTAGYDVNTAVTVNIPPGGQVSVPYDVRVDAGWGSEAGSYALDLVYQLFDATALVELASQRTRLILDIPTVARVRFAGASGSGGPAQVEMGELSPIAPTTSPPLAIRVLSTAGYRMQLSSANGGALVRIGGSERIPYHLTLSGRLLDLSGGAGWVHVGQHTSAAGDVHPVSITIYPDPTRHAGNYTDRVTITVTPS